MKIQHTVTLNTLRKMYVTSHAWHRRQMHVMKRGFYKSAYIKEKSTCKIKKKIRHFPVHLLSVLHIIFLTFWIYFLLICWTATLHFRYRKTWFWHKMWRQSRYILIIFKKYTAMYHTLRYKTTPTVSSDLNLYNNNW